MKLKMYCSTCDVEGEFEIPTGMTQQTGLELQCPFCSNILETDVDLESVESVFNEDDEEYGDERA